MKISGWGRYPVIDAQVLEPADDFAAQAMISPAFAGIARGMGRSYGDSALAAQVLQSRRLADFISFDEQSGVLHCGAGVSLGEILRLFARRGWFLPVLPGTRHVSIGGAIASDVHGKNHHVHGSFCDHIDELDLLVADGQIIRCSPTENTDIFRATCGGMGLTGVILRAAVRLREVSDTRISQRCIRTDNLAATLEQIEANEDATYSVAWLDCMARGDKLGRSLLYLAEHSSETRDADHQVPTIREPRLSVPFSSPGILLNRWSMSAFNAMYYHLGGGQLGERSEASTLDYQKYFFPLDNIANWNRLYGSKGFLQYQFVVPTPAAAEAIGQVLQRITRAGKGSFLSVLKKFGEANQNLLSFPQPGYTLTLDFKREASLMPLLDELDRIVLDHGGRLYLAKDARMSKETFQSSYPEWESFTAIRRRLGAHKVFNSLQSARLGL